MGIFQPKLKKKFWASFCFVLHDTKQHNETCVLFNNLAAHDFCRQRKLSLNRTFVLDNSAVNELHKQIKTSIFHIIYKRVMIQDFIYNASAGFNKSVFSKVQ